MQRTVSPVDGRVYVERATATPADIDRCLTQAHQAQAAFRGASVTERAALCHKAVDAFVSRREEIARELSWQMGRPVRHTPSEVDVFEERARHMIDIAARALSDIDVGPKPGFSRFIRREPLGVVFTVAPWNYPYLTSVNSVIPALMAGNCVLLKHSAQTPLCAERYAEAFADSPLARGVFQYLHMKHEDVARIISDRRIDCVAFTGSVQGGRAIARAAADGFIPTGLELGGKDPAYVRPDADLEYSIAELVDGAFYNAGQSCCGIERIYAHRDVYDRFVEGYVAGVKDYRLGDPLDPDTTLGPLVRPSAAGLVREHIDEALTRGARALLDRADFVADDGRSNYVAPQVLVDVDHGMRVMTEETFGPVVGIMRVDDDEQAVELMNDSAYGLTASIWTSDADAATALGDRLQTGTVFMNRCDYLDPALAWTGVKDSGRGCTLSALGYEQLTRPKSFHLKTDW